MVPTGGNPERRWGTALALSGAVLFLYIVDAFPLIALSLAVLLLALPPHRLRYKVFAALVVLWALVLFPASSAAALVSRGWGLLVGGAFVLATLLRPRWSFFGRSLAAVAGTLLLTAAWLAASGAWTTFDWMMGEHFRLLSLITSGDLAARLPDSPWTMDFHAASERVAEWRGSFFPALLGLQSLAALGLVWWAFLRAGTGSGEEGLWEPLGRLRDFRFHDQLVWVAIAGLVLMLLPFGPLAARAGANVLVFMGALYALRGAAVFVFLAGRSPSIVSVIFGALAAIFLYPLVLTAALLVGLGDTWLDVRGRVALASSS